MSLKWTCSGLCPGWRMTHDLGPSPGGVDHCLHRSPWNKHRILHEHGGGTLDWDACLSDQESFVQPSTSHRWWCNSHLPKTVVVSEDAFLQVVWSHASLVSSEVWRVVLSMMNADTLVGAAILTLSFNNGLRQWIGYVFPVPAVPVLLSVCPL